MANNNVLLKKISVGPSVGKAKPGSVNIYVDAEGVLKQVDEHDEHSEVSPVQPADLEASEAPLRFVNIIHTDRIISLSEKVDILVASVNLLQVSLDAANARLLILEQV